MKSGQAEIDESSKGTQKRGLMSRRIAIFEFLLRIIAFFNTISSAILMATTNETLPFFTQFIRFHADYNDLPALTFFVVANAVAMGGLLASGASSAAAIVYLAHNGNNNTNWFPVCQQFNSFCERTSGSLIGSFIAVALLILLIILSAFALSRRH
ncbi:casparian strip membrane protein 5 isoform X2 [Raphanus sativus]|uniref:CASP-like protein n=1 Tax=Raphanus sativus TaxID=3726 RepID=A0A9W3DCS7_RAPSA|nr:casparian strip membrane protein 5 isoform X2 [Raphanus sativus]